MWRDRTNHCFRLPFCHRGQVIRHTARYVWRLRANIIRTALCWIVWPNVHSPQHTYMSSSYRSSRLSLSHRNPYAVRRGSCVELYYCNMVEWFWWDSSLISTTNWFPSVLWHCWFGHLACKNRPRNDLLHVCVEWHVKPYTLTHGIHRVYLSGSTDAVRHFTSLVAVLLNVCVMARWLLLNPHAAEIDAWLASGRLPGIYSSGHCWSDEQSTCGPLPSGLEG